jgi:uncharacterized protein YjbI with pentapeptide repeats
LTSLHHQKQHCDKIFSNLAELNREIGDIEFENCEFDSCDFTEIIFRKCTFINCTFNRCNLSVIKVPQSLFTNITFNECKIIGVDWSRAAWHRLIFSKPLQFHQCILNGSSFLGLTLDEIVLEECIAHDVDFREASLCRAVFTATDFTHSLFGKTDLSGADFTDAENYDIDIFNNKISKAKFSRYTANRLLNSLDIQLVD